MAYNTYHLMLGELERNCYNAGILSKNKKLRGEFTMRESIRFILTEDPQMLFTLDMAILIEEYFWLQTKKVIFPESILLLNSLLKASTRIKNSTQLFGKDFECFSLAFPREFKINNLPSTGVLVTILSHAQRKQISNDFFKWVTAKTIDTKYFSETIICLSYNYPSDNKQMYSRAIIPVPLIDKLLNAPTPDAYYKILGGFSNEIIGSIPLNVAEAAYQQILAKLVLAILVYKKANPNALVHGFPTKKKPKLNGFAVKNFESLHLKMPRSTHSSPEEHYRSWTFKQLFALRYYQGEYAHLEPGSRIVFVNETFVNMKNVDPNTLVER
jgi:hypothetical protein